MAPRDRWRGSWKGGHEELPWPGFQGARKAPAFAKKLSSPSRRFLPSLKYTPAHHERFLPWVKGRPLSNYHFLVAKTHVTLPAVCPLLRVVRTSSGTLQETVTRSHDMSLQPEAFQGGPKRPPGSSVTCGRRKDLKTRRDFLDEATGYEKDWTPAQGRRQKNSKGRHHPIPHRPQLETTRSFQVRRHHLVPWRRFQSCRSHTASSPTFELVPREPLPHQTLGV
ncbi:uncharacterized protein LOC122221668 isoform X1 [Panthera leo]|uniref:uncharacterized protein LOC122221668 isoform X1 n=1 Tax=Panthera leo TaxID=9689 RepID=UPI001C6984B7|nr:uncharacterized protein LOC122221668 isoform X1 [Panthera leo]